MTEGILLDTHVLLWWLGGDPRLGPHTRARIEDRSTTVQVSAASVWEAAIKRALGKLQTPDDLPEVIVASGFSPLDVTPAHAWATGHLPPLHRDPFDRLLIAQAQLGGLEFATDDEQIDQYDLDVWDARS